MTRLATAFVIALTVVALAAAPALADASRLVLKGVNVIEGEASGYVPVRLPKPATVDAAFFPNASVSVEGAGKLHAVVLRQPGPKPVEEPVLAAGRFDPAIFCSGTCRSPLEGISVIGGGGMALPDSGPWKLPAGDYRLYLVTDGPGRVTLRLPELEGEQRLAPTVRTAAVTKVLPSRTPADVANMRVHGDSAQLGTDGIVFETHLLYYGLHAHSELWTCYYFGEPTHPLSFYPGCPSEDGQEGMALWIQYGIVNPAPGVAAGVGMLRPSVGGTYGAGGSMTSVSTAGSSGWAAAWIDFETTGPAGPAATPDPAPGQGAPVARSSRTEVAGRVISVRDRRARVRLRCEGERPCRGSLRIANGPRRRFEVAAGAVARVRVKVPAALARRARRGRGVKATLSVAEGTAVRSVPVRLRA